MFQGFTQFLLVAVLKMLGRVCVSQNIDITWRFGFFLGFPILDTRVNQPSADNITHFTVLIGFPENIVAIFVLVSLDVCVNNFTDFGTEPRIKPFEIKKLCRLIHVQVKRPNPIVAPNDIIHLFLLLSVHRRWVNHNQSPIIARRCFFV